MARPGGHQPHGELPAGLDQEGAGAHRRIADLQRQHLLRRRVRPDAGEGGLQRVAHDRLGQRAGGVVAARAPPLIGRLQQRRARWHRPVRAAAWIDDRQQGLDQRGGVGRRGECGGDARR